MFIPSKKESIFIVVDIFHQSCCCWCCPEVVDCVPNSHCRMAMHPVLTLGKLGGDCPIRMRKGCQGGVGRHQGDPTSARVCSKVPTVLSWDPPLASFPRFHDSIIKDSPNSRTVELTFQPHIRCHYWGTITARLVKRSTSICHPTIIQQYRTIIRQNWTVIQQCWTIIRHVIWASTIIACRRIVPLCSPYDPLYARLFCHPTIHLLHHCIFYIMTLYLTLSWWKLKIETDHMIWSISVRFATLQSICPTRRTSIIRLFVCICIFIFGSDFCICLAYLYACLFCQAIIHPGHKLSAWSEEHLLPQLSGCRRQLVGLYFLQ